MLVMIKAESMLRAMCGYCTVLKIVVLRRTSLESWNIDVCVKHKRKQLG